jgi:hypothetical protein
MKATNHGLCRQLAVVCVAAVGNAVVCVVCAGVAG